MTKSEFYQLFSRLFSLKHYYRGKEYIFARVYMYVRVFNIKILATEAVLIPKGNIYAT